MKIERFLKYFNHSTQVIIPVFTIFSQIALTSKNPQLGIFINLLVQPFWIYSGWLAFKKAGQIGLFVTAIIVTIILLIGLLNYQFN